MSAVWVEPLNGGDLGTIYSAHRGNTRSRRSSFNMYGAGAAHANAAPEFGSRETKLVAYHPEQWHIIGTVNGYCTAIEIEGGHNRLLPWLSVSAMPPTPAGWRQ